MVTSLSSVFQIDEEVSKLLQLKAQLGDEQRPQFNLKCPKVRNGPQTM